MFLRLISNSILFRKFGKIIVHTSNNYYGRLELSQLPRLETISTKTREAELDISFMGSCQQLNVLPNFICFQLPNVNKVDVNTIRKRLLRIAIKKICKEKRRLQNEKDKLEGVIGQVSTGIDFFILNKALVKNVSRVVHLTVKNIKINLRKLTKNCILPFDSKETDYNFIAYN